MSPGMLLNSHSRLRTHRVVQLGDSWFRLTGYPEVIPPKMRLCPDRRPSANNVDPCIARVAVARLQCVHQSTLADLSVLTGMEDRSGGRVGQSDRVLSDGIKLHQAKRRPGTGEVRFTGAEHVRTKVQAILVNEARMVAASDWSERESTVG
jgi:hypothetical protein